MSHFYGTLQGNRGEATRCGSKDSGIETYTASWKGAVNVRAWHDETAGIDMVSVSLVPWHGRGINHELYCGPIGGSEKLQRAAEAKQTRESASFMKTVAGIAKLGELMVPSKAEQNDWKLRMLKAGLESRGLMIPEDWGTLSEDEKERRLNAVIAEASK